MTGTTPGGKSGRQLVLEQLHAHKSHELIPRSGKVVAFDVDLSLRHALEALAEHRVGYAPLWDSARQEFVSVLDGEDFAQLLALLGREAAQGGGGVLGRSPDEISLRELLRACRPAVPPPLFTSLGPDESLFSAVQAMLDGRLLHLPLVDCALSVPAGADGGLAAVTAAAGPSAGSGAGATIVHVLTPLRVLSCIVNSPMFQSDTRIFGERLGDLAIGTLLPTPQAAAAVIAATHACAGIGDGAAVGTSIDAAAHGGMQGAAVCVAVHAHAPLWHALALMGQFGCTSLPVLDSAESGMVLSAVTEERVLAIARSMPHADLNAPISQALGPQPPATGAVCVSVGDSLHALMAALSTRNCERLAVANEMGQLVGAVSVLDVLKFFAQCTPQG
mmetsp:Transcript_5085/g.13178  ORF Transcript_5085/g.13178 Transcript_5085/m.13178 type:complete len:390 (-) Transcript_5085:144-1313(-)